jgi:type II secretory pathway pseudopilin PulG
MRSAILCVLAAIALVYATPSPPGFRESETTVPHRDADNRTTVARTWASRSQVQGHGYGHSRVTRVALPPPDFSILDVRDTSSSTMAPEPPHGPEANPPSSNRVEKRDADGRGDVHDTTTSSDGNDPNLSSDAANTPGGTLDARMFRLRPSRRDTHARADLESETSPIAISDDDDCAPLSAGFEVFAEDDLERRSTTTESESPRSLEVNPPTQ